VYIYGGATLYSTTTFNGSAILGGQQLSFNNSGVRSWGIQVSGGNLNFTSGDGAGVFYFNSSLTTLGTLTVGGPIVRSAAGQGWLSGSYNSVETTVTTGAIYSIGGSYYPTSTSLNNMYGVGYSYNNFTGAMGPSNLWCFYVCSGGVANITLGTNGTGYFTGDVIAYYSDKRLKTNIRPIENALSKVMQIGGYFYNPNDLAIELGATQDRDERVGVMAQEIQAVLPHAIKDAPFDRTGTYMTVQYDKLVPLLIQAMKEQQLQIEELKNQLDAFTK